MFPWFVIFTLNLSVFLPIKYVTYKQQTFLKSRLETFSLYWLLRARVTREDGCSWCRPPSCCLSSVCPARVLFLYASSLAFFQTNQVWFHFSIHEPVSCPILVTIHVTSQRTQELCNNLASPPIFVLAASCITLLFLLKTHRNDQCCFKPSRSFPDLQGYPPWCFFSLFCLGKFFFSPTAGFSYFLSAGKEFSLSCLSAWKGLHTALMHEECFCWVQTSKLATLSAALLRCRSLSSGFCSFCWKVSHQSYSSERNVLFLQLLLRFFFLSLVFNSVTTMCPDVVFCCCYLVFILLGVHWASWIYRLMSFNRFGKFSPAVSLDITSVPFFSPLFSETPMTHKLNTFTIFHVSLLFSHSFYFLWASARIFFIALPSSSLTLSYIVSRPLLHYLMNS